MSSPPPTTHDSPITPSLKGCVNTFYRHYKGKKLGPYHVRRWKVGRKVYRQYIKPQDVERVKAACQSHRENRKNTNKFVSNYEFLGKMMERVAAKRVLTRGMDNYILRLHFEGMHITGRPQMRRRVTRTIATVDGKRMIVKTVFELDGTTKTFMVPFFTKSPWERLKEEFQEIIGEPLDLNWQARARFLTA